MIHFLVDASLPRATGDLIRSFGHEATDIRDIGLGTAPDEAIAAYAKGNRLALITRDQGFGNVLDYPPENYNGIVVLNTPDGANRSVVLAMVESFLQEASLIEQLVGHLAVVDQWRIRLRPA